jgi:hypothetical protein
MPDISSLRVPQFAQKKRGEAILKRENHKARFFRTADNINIVGDVVRAHCPSPGAQLCEPQRVEASTIIIFTT